MQRNFFLELLEISLVFFIYSCHEQIQEIVLLEIIEPIIIFRIDNRILSILGAPSVEIRLLLIKVKTIK